MGPCPPGTQATVDMRFCEPCKGDDFNLVAGGTCRPCPLGAKCTAGDRLEALPDWWCVLSHAAFKHAHSGVRLATRRVANTSAVLFSCPMHAACQSGPDAGDRACATGCVLLSSHVDCSVLTTDALFSYTGPVCAICSPGFYPWGALASSACLLICAAAHCVVLVQRP